MKKFAYFAAGVIAAYTVIPMISVAVTNRPIRFTVGNKGESLSEWGDES